MLTYFFYSVLSSESKKVKLLEEVSIMLSFKHPNVMSLTGLCFDGEVPLIIMPFMSDGSVLGYIRRNRESLYFTEHSLEEKVVCACVAVFIVCGWVCDVFSSFIILCGLYNSSSPLTCV